MKLKRKNRHKCSNYDTSHLKISNVDQEEHEPKYLHIINMQKQVLNIFPFNKRI